MPAPSLLAGQRGFTLVEVLVTMLILAVGIGGAIAMIDGANARTVVTKEREAATALVREVLESARSVPYNRLTTTGVANELKALPGLEDSTPATIAWTVERRNQTYTLAVSACSVDDDQDGLGDHTGGGFCSPSTATADSSPDDYKRLTITAGWTRGSNTRTLTHAGIVNNESAGSGPDLAIVDLDPDPDSNGMITSDTSPITFDVQTDPDAVSVKYAVDGVVMETDTLSGGTTTASFGWDVDGGADPRVPDGTYVVSATAYDAQGRPGITRSLTVRLNRDAPAKVEDVFGGWNARLDIVELQWSRSAEPDIIGYRVYRRTGAGPFELVPGCDFPADAEAVECLDMAPPAVAEGQTIDYVVVALDEDPFTQDPREGVASDVLVATRRPTQPNGPALVTATASNGDIHLDWPASLPAIPDYTGSSVVFYRVYRDGTQLADRHARTGQEDLLSYVDRGAALAGHKYWITAVDSNYSESEPVGGIP